MTSYQRMFCSSQYHLFQQYLGQFDLHLSFSTCCPSAEELAAVLFSQKPSEPRFEQQDVIHSAQWIYPASGSWHRLMVGGTRPVLYRTPIWCGQAHSRFVVVAVDFATRSLHKIRKKALNICLKV